MLLQGDQESALISGVEEPETTLATQRKRRFASVFQGMTELLSAEGDKQGPGKDLLLIYRSVMDELDREKKKKKIFPTPDD